MADNRIAYGLAKKYGIDTRGMSPKEVWEALKGKGITQANAQEKYSAQSENREKAEKIYNSDGIGGEHIPTEAEKKRLEELGIKNEEQGNALNLPDEDIPKSVGAKWINEEVKMPDGSTATFVEGSKVIHKQVFAGKGTKKPIRDVGRLVSQYKGSKAEEWQKVKGIAELEQNGEQYNAEIHWYEEPSIGRVETKFKKYIG